MGSQRRYETDQMEEQTLIHKSQLVAKKDACFKNQEICRKKDY